MKKLSVVLSTRNEEDNILECINSVKNIADEIVVVDEYSDDKTAQIAKDAGAKVFFETHHQIFHITKQKALTLATNEWILQLDADERVSDGLSKEIIKVINMNDREIEVYQENIPEIKLFNRHWEILEKRDGKIGTKEGEYAGFFVARRNYFLGNFLRYGGIYPDGVIRLVKKGKAGFPCKSVHEQIEIDGRVGWLANPLFHYADKTFKHYLKRNSYYIDLMVNELVTDKTDKNISNFIRFVLIKPIGWFLLTQIRHKGILDGWRGIVFSFFSGLRFPRAYFRYLKRV